MIDVSAERAGKLALRLVEALERIEQLEDEARERARWLACAKKQAGYDDNVSFDRVWSDALSALKREREPK